MIFVQRNTNKRSAVRSYLLGICSTIMIILLGAFLCTSLILNGKMPEKSADKIISLIMFLGALIGGIISQKLSNESPLTCALFFFGGTIILIGILNVLLFSGIQIAFGGRGVYVLCGSAASAIICVIKKPKKQFKKLRSR